MSSDHKIVRLNTAKPKAEADKILRQKWGSVLDDGFTVVPSVLIHSLTAMKLGATELAILVALIDLWWSPADMPWPSKSKLAKRLGISESTVQRSLKRLVAEGLIVSEARFRGHGGQTSNRYDLTPLVARLEAISKDLKTAEAAADDLKRKAVRKSAPAKASPRTQAAS